MSSEKKAPADEGFETERWVFIGTFTPKEKGKVGIRFIHVLADDVLDTSDALDFPVKRSTVGSLRAGAVYNVEVKRDPTDPGKVSARIASRTYAGMFSDSARVSIWQTAEREREITKRLAQKEKTETARNYIREALAPVRQLYTRTDAVGKMAIEVQVLSYLRYGKDLTPDA